MSHQEEVDNLLYNSGYELSTHNRLIIEEYITSLHQQLDELKFVLEGLEH